MEKERGKVMSHQSSHHMQGNPHCASTVNEKVVRRTTSTLGARGRTGTGINIRGVDGMWEHPP